MAAMQVDGGEGLLLDGATQIDVGIVAGLSAANGGKGLAAGVAVPFESIAPVTVDEVRERTASGVEMERGRWNRESSDARR